LFIIFVLVTYRYSYLLVRYIYIELPKFPAFLFGCQVMLHLTKSESSSWVYFSSLSACCPYHSRQMCHLSSSFRSWRQSSIFEVFFHVLSLKSAFPVLGQSRQTSST